MQDKAAAEVVDTSKVPADESMSEPYSTRNATMQGSLPEVVYTPESALRDPARLLREMWQDLMASRELAWRLAVRDIRASYRQSFLGYAWMWVPPIVATLAFVMLRSGGVFKTAALDLPYPVFVLVGTTLWQIFSDALCRPLGVLTVNRALLTKINFPKEALVLSGVYLVLFNSLVRLVILIPVILYYRAGVATALVTFPFSLLSLLLLGTCLGLLLVPIGMLYTDVQRALTMIIPFWMFVTPVVFPMAETGIAATIMSINPVTPLILTGRQLITGQPVTHLAFFYLITGISVALLLLGWLLYRIAIPHVTARLGM